MNSFQIIILSFFMSITVMSVSAQNNDSIKINNFSIAVSYTHLRAHETTYIDRYKGKSLFCFPCHTRKWQNTGENSSKTKSASLIKSRERLNIYSIQSAMEYNNMFNSDVSQSTLDMAGKVSVTAATWKLLYEKGVGYGGIVYVEPDGWIFYC